MRSGEVVEQDGCVHLSARGADDEPSVHGPEEQHHGVVPDGMEAVRVPCGDAA